MKLFLNLSFFFFVLVIWGDKSLSLSNYQIKEICKKEKRKSICIKNLQEKKYNLKKGNVIEIPVIPYKR
tara:strand:+ start:258 stop:464 length:207 start_codon:yes stop_codon:yes gene_type:complete